MKSIRRNVRGQRNASESTKAISAVPPSRFGHWSLRTYLLALIALFVAAAVGGGAYISLQTVNQAHQTASVDTSYAAHAAATALATDIDQVQAAVAGLASTPGVARLLKNPVGCTLSFAGGHLDLVRPDGSIACTSAGAVPAIGYGAASWLPRALQSPMLVAPYYDPTTREQVVVSTAPIPGGGAVAGFVDLSPIGPALAAIYGGPTHFELFVTASDDRTVLGRSIAPNRWVGTTLAAPHFGSGTAELERNDVTGTMRIYGDAVVKGTGWHVYAGESAATALAAAHTAAAQDLGIILGGALVVVIALLIVYRKIARPITRLDAAVRAAQVDRTFQPISANGPTEVATLAASFSDLMSDVNRELTQRREAEEASKQSLAQLEIIDAQRRRLLANLVTAQEEERRRIASDVHDDSIQVMAAALMRISLIRQQPLEPVLDAQLAKLQDTSEQAIQRLRSLLFQLRPPSLDREGLAVALDEYLAQWAPDANIAYRVDNRLDEEVPEHVRAILFRIAQEALTNVRKHAQAAEVTVTLEGRASGIALRIEDDGVGMAGADFGESRVGHLGLITMRERAELAGGWCRVEGMSLRGTSVEAWIPVSVEADAVA